MSIPVSLLSVILSAIMLSLGIPNELFKQGMAIFGLLALIPLYLALRESKSWTAAGLLGGLMMFLVHLFSSFWLAQFKDFAIFTLGGSALVNLFFGILAGWLLRYALLFPRTVRPFLFAAVWTIWEWFKSTGFFGYPWGTLAMTSRELVPLIQIAEITGIWGIGFLLSLIPALLAETLFGGFAPTSVSCSTKRPGRTVILRPAGQGLQELGPGYMRNALAFTGFILALSLSFGCYRLSFPPKPETSLNVTIVQQNADPWIEGAIRKNLMTSQDLTRKAIAASGKKADLVVWSESSLPWPYLENRDYYALYPKDDPFGKFLADTGAPLLAGSPVLVDPETKGYSNSVVLIGPDGRQLDWYAKIQLVPFAEYMPFTEHKWVRKFFDTVVGFSDGWIPGKAIKTLSVTNATGKEIHFAAPICFEDAFPALIARLHNSGSDLLVNLTNDSWSRTESAEYQHFTVASFRAIELRTTLVRSTNAGYSVVVNPLGKVIFDMPLFITDAINVPVPIYPHTTTFYARFGDWFPSLLALIVALSAIGHEVIDRKRRYR